MAGQDGHPRGGGLHVGRSRRRACGTFSESWAQTKNKVDVLAAAHSGTLLALDDTRTFEADTRAGFGNFKEAVMRMAEGQLKGRYGDAARPSGRGRRS